MKFFQPIEDIIATRNNNKVAKGKTGEAVKMPFNSTNKFALTVIEQAKEKSHYVVYIKGAPEKVWKYCSSILVNG